MFTTEITESTEMKNEAKIRLDGWVVERAPQTLPGIYPFPKFPVLPESSCSHLEFRFHAHFTQDAKRVISTTESTEITETSSKPPPLCALCPLWFKSSFLMRTHPGVFGL